ncbi:MAG: Fic family protein [Desulfitobacterium hafniense]|nr:Fic family protein [Desulfitobacterium hafniense]
MDNYEWLTEVMNLYTYERYLTRKEILFRVKPKARMEFSQMWDCIIELRKAKGHELPLKDQTGRNFWYMIPPFAEKLIHEISFKAKHRLEELATKELHRKLLIEDMMFEEAFYSSVIEGAFTTKQRAKEVVRNKNPRDKSEQMILNNYQALVFILENLDKELDEELLIQIHKIVTYNTLDEDEQTERYRDGQVYVTNPNETEPVYVPPSAEKVKPMMDDLFSFINDKSESSFVHPVIKAAIIHFYIGYVHPFFDGNGRVARALSYMYLLKEGYEFFKFFSISSMINRHRNKYYKSFIDSEENNNDVTYFIIAQLVISLDSIQEVLDKLLNELQNQVLQENLIKDGIFLASRQHKFIQMAEKKEYNTITIEDYKKKLKVSYETARKDLTELEELGILKKLKKGNKYIFMFVGLKGYLN